MEITTLPDEAVRLECVERADNSLFSIGEPYTVQDTVHCAMALQEYVENGCAGICQGCMKAMKE